MILCRYCQSPKRRATRVKEIFGERVDLCDEHFEIEEDLDRQIGDLCLDDTRECGVAEADAVGRHGLILM